MHVTFMHATFEIAASSIIYVALRSYEGVHCFCEKDTIKSVHKIQVGNICLHKFSKLTQFTHFVNANNL